MLNNIELQMDYASGETVTLLASIQLIRMDQTQALLMSFLDISDRVRAEQQIHGLAYDLTKAEQAERQRISQMLHDDLQQRIFAAKVQTFDLDNACRQGDLQAAQADLSPAILQGEGLSDALSWLAGQMQEHYGLYVSIQTNGVSTRFEDTLRMLLFQAVMEALFNVVKHAETLQATVTLDKTNNHIQITISDDGVGFPSNSIDQEKNTGGLAHIQRRIHLVGCQLHIQSQPGKGTRVIIQIPVELVTA